MERIRPTNEVSARGRCSLLRLPEDCGDPDLDDDLRRSCLPGPDPDPPDPLGDCLGGMAELDSEERPEFPACLLEPRWLFLGTPHHRVHPFPCKQENACALRLLAETTKP